jgi:hypothetical protein
MAKAAEAKEQKTPNTILFPVMVPAALAANLQLKAGDKVSVPEILVKIAEQFGDLPLDQKRGFYIDDPTRERIEMAMQKAMQDPELELPRYFERATRFNLAGVKLDPGADLVERAYERNVADTPATEWWNEVFRLFLEKVANGDII